MEAKGIKATTLTSELGLPISAVTDWKKGKCKPSTDAVIKLADYFGVTTDYLLLGKKTNSEVSLKKMEDIVMDKRYINDEVMRKGLLACFKSYVRQISFAKMGITISLMDLDLTELSNNTDIRLETLDSYRTLSTIGHSDKQGIVPPYFHQFIQLMNVTGATGDKDVNACYKMLKAEDELLKAKESKNHQDTTGKKLPS
jgi:transcriptional regulator with XRE-family HTH domain